MKLTSILLLLSTGVAASYAQQAKPNIILFMVDDMGWQDTSLPFWKDTTALNRMYHTPSMERLAAQGVKFTRAYASPVSSPTRVSLMTGMNPAAHRVTNWTLEKDKSTDDPSNTLIPPAWNLNGLQPAGDQTPLSVAATTFPMILQQNGYRTIHCGKAHWGAKDTPGEDPRNLGFDINIAGHAAGGLASYLGEQNFGNRTDGQPQSLFAIPGLEQYWGQDIFVTKALTEQACLAMDEARGMNKPFYLYMSHYAIHVPLDKDKRFYQKYRDAGLDDNQARYASLIEGMDESLGEIMDYLDQNDIARNTIVIFMSDNGGLTFAGRSGAPDTQNYPLGSGKGSAYEGGVRVPMIVSMPMVADTARVCETPVEICDFMPTILEMAGVSKYKTVQKESGMSIMPLLRGESPKKFNRSLYWHFPNLWGGTGLTSKPLGRGYGAWSSMLKNNYKLVYYYELDRCELFDLSNDISEKIDLAGQGVMSELRQAMLSDLSNYLRRTKAQLPSHANGTPCKYPDGRVYKPQK